MDIVVTDYDSTWPEQAAQARARLTDALPGLFLEIEHVGSTSVPGLAAKPIIDLMASVPSLDAVTPEHETALADEGFHAADSGMTDRLFYVRHDGAGRRSHHLHVVDADTWDTRNERLFRDHLRAHPDVAAEYGALKQRLAAEVRDPDTYTRRKTDLVQRVVDRERTARGLPLEDVWEE